MRYVSTRGRAGERGFTEVLLGGLAPDGGLYVPVEIPELATPGDDYAAIVAAVVEPFVSPDPLATEVESSAHEAYRRFRHPEVAPLRDMGGGRFLLELFWGPTFSFKDYALQLVAQLFDHALAQRGERLLIVGATSGDTGSAAIEAVRGKPAIDIVILFPDGAVSEVQRRQMTTVIDSNVSTVAVDGTFDDCQRLVKMALTTLAGGRRLGAINSINWGRIVAQAAYYVHATASLGDETTFVVPTGNFGNVLSGHLARRMGAPISGLVVANNANHGLADLIDTGKLEVRPVTATTSPAMDIQVPSNLERWLFEALDGDGAAVEELQRHLADGGLRLPDPLADRLSGDFAAGWHPDEAVSDTIRRVHDQTGVILDPHTAVAWGVAEETTGSGPTVVVATAHPAKFGIAVEAATGVAPVLPTQLAHVLDLPERMTRIPADLAALEAALDSVVA